ncbi:MAG: hypothetical protein CVV64_04100 [Candidatus Wallbacteria bacterium HGW-Wallbacteria-1]|jgi:hypothetical protein|uniref:VWFA domain-containing protein n=1 Tax=Candidatus Wallbacteria bacterium HGW-Wallbacteria-1 TaxID=2013854 RepID=A0A2N1PRJ5_9BACT|nr:MAG: hypothetical protein CVV64_04100 [Candidatus Wallbacteria bacterium HGW-Wallbacteria-1]
MWKFLQMTVLALIFTLFAIPASNGSNQKDILSLNFITTSFPEISVLGEFPDKFTTSETTPGTTSGDSPIITEDDEACAVTQWMAPPPEILAILCVSRSSLVDHDMETAQNLAYFIHSKLNDRFRFVFASAGTTAEFPISEPTRLSGVLRSAVFSLNPDKGEAFIDSILKVSENFMDIPMPKVIIYFGPARDSRQNGKLLSEKNLQDLAISLRTIAAPMYIFETTGREISLELKKIINESGGEVFTPDSESVTSLADALDKRSERMFNLVFTSPNKSRNGILRTVTLTSGEKSFSGTYYPPADAPVGESRLVLTSLDGNDRPYPGKYMIQKAGRTIAEGQIGQDGLLVVQGIQGEHSVTLTDGIHSQTKTVNVIKGRDAHVAFRFFFATLTLGGQDQYGKSLDVKFTVTPISENQSNSDKTETASMIMQGRTSTRVKTPLELLPGKYTIVIESNGESQTRTLDVRGGQKKEWIAAFRRKNFTLSATDLNSIPIVAQFKITEESTGREILGGNLGDDGRETINIPTGKYKITFSYLDRNIDRRFSVSAGEISGVTVKFPLYPVRLISTQKNGMAVIAEYIATNTETMKTCAFGKTSESGTAMLHLEKGNYKFFFTLGDATIEKFETISEKKIHEIKASFAEATLNLHVMNHEDRPVEGWYQIELPANRLKIASGIIDRKGCRVRLEPGDYRILVKPDIMSSKSIARDFQIEPAGLDMVFNFSASLNIKWKGPADNSMDKCWYELFDDSGKKEVKIQEGRIFTDGRSLRLAPGNYRICMKPSPFTQFEFSSSISLEPEKDSSVSADFSGIIVFRSEITDRPEKPYYRVFTADEKTELARGMIENGTSRVITPPGTYIARLTPFLSSQEKHEETIKIDSGKTVTVSADFKLSQDKK